MMQFSAAPWRVRDAAHLAAVKKAVDIRKKFTPEIPELARQSAMTGEPIINSLEYEFPNQGYETVTNEFMLGADILVAPVDNQSTSRNVILPNGKWTSDDGKIYAGGKVYAINVPLDRLPYFILNKQQ